MESFLKSFEIGIAYELLKLLTKAHIIIGGVGLIASSALACWATYRTFLIMAGMSSDPLLPLFKDFLVKATILLIATTGALYSEYFSSVILQTANAISAELSGSMYVMDKVGESLEIAIDGLHTTTAEPDQVQSNASGFGWLWQKVKSIWDSVEYVFGGWWSTLVTFIQLMIVTAGILYLALVAVMTVITSKVYLLISLAFGPIFTMFGAFETTRNWFWSWISATIGYAMTFVLVMFVWGFMLDMFDDFFFKADGNPVTWFDVWRSFLACFFFAKIVARAGDLASSWFGAGNITDGTNALLAAAGVKGASGAIRGGRAIGGASARAVNGIRQGTRLANNSLSRTRVSRA